MLRLLCVQQLRFEAQERNDLGADLSLNSPLRPVVEIWFKVEVHEPVPQRSRHGEVNTTFRRRIAGGNDNPSLRQHIFAELSVEHQLVTSGLHHLRRRSKFIEKENSFAATRKELGWHPLGLIGRDAGQTAEIDRIKLYCSHIDKVIIEIARYLRNDL
jgi:hypothetical protein